MVEIEFKENLDEKMKNNATLIPALVKPTTLASLQGQGNTSWCTLK